MSPIKRPRFGGVFLFCPATTQPNTSVYSAFCAIHASYTANTAKQRTGLYMGIPCYLPRFAVAVWRCIRLYRTAYTTLEHITAPGRCTGQHSRHIIIRYIKGQRFALCYGSMPARRGQFLPSANRWQVLHPAHLVSLAPSTRRGSPAAGAWRAARNHWRLSPYLFSGFRPIANRGQQ